MKILIVSSGLRPDHFGGLPSHVEDVIRGLAERGTKVSYLNVGHRGTRPGTHLAPRGGLPCPAWNLSSRWAFTAYWSGTVDPVEQVAPDATLSAALGRVADEAKPDIVHFHELTSFPVAAASIFRERGARTIFSAHDFFALCPTAKLQRPDKSTCDRAATELDCDLCSKGARSNRFLQLESVWDRRLAFSTPIRNTVRRLIRSREQGIRNSVPREAYQVRRHEFARQLAAFDTVLMTSNDQKRRFERHCGPGVRLHLLPLSRSTFATRQPAPRTETVESGKCVFVALNIVNPAKGLALLESAFTDVSATHPNVELRLYGPEEPHSPGIRRLGKYSDRDLDRIIGSADFGIIPSIWPEAYGYVGPEMLSRGLPVIASDVGAMPDYVVHEGNGMLFDPKSPTALATTIRALADDPALRERLWAGVAATPRRYLLMHEHLDQLLALYGLLLGQSRLRTKSGSAKHG